MKNYKIKHKAKSLINKSLYSIPEFTKNLVKKFRIPQIQDAIQFYSISLNTTS